MRALGNRRAYVFRAVKEGDKIAITTTQVTQMHDIVKTLQDGPESAKEIICSEVPWLGEELGKACGKYYKVQG